MSIKTKKYTEIPPIEFLLLRERLGLKRYIKTRGRDCEKKRILLSLALKKICEKEEDDFILIGYRRRRINCL